MSDRPRRLRRVELSVPGSSEKMMAKAAGLGADYVFLDLEDAVAPNAKVEARNKVVTALTSLEWGRTTRAVRVNDVETEYTYDDIIAVVEGAGDALDCLILPKAKSASDVLFVDTLLSQIEKKKGLKKKIGLEVLIEEVEGLMNVEEIAASTPRLEALIFGMGDYSASQGIDIRSIGGDAGYPGDIWHYTRYKVTVAARANKIDAIDGPFANFNDADGYREEARRAMILGMAGKWAIHPNQVSIANEVFSPDPKQVARARDMARQYDEALERGEGSVNVNGVMVDAASIRILRNVIDRADLIGM